MQKGIYKTKILDFEKNIQNRFIRNPLINIRNKSYGMFEDFEEFKNSLNDIISSKRKYFILITKITKKDIVKEKQYKWTSWGGFVGKRKLKTDFFST